MVRVLLSVCLLCAVLGCGSKTDPLNPPDAPVIPPSTRTRDNPGLPPKPADAPSLPAR